MGISHTRHAMEKIRRDATRVVERARYVIITDGNGTILDTRLNKRSAVDILAVIGPADTGNDVVADTVLLEIGLRRARPYRRLRRINGRNHGFFSRRKLAGLNDRQLQNILPRIETLLTDYAVERQMQWKIWGWPIPITETRVSRKKRRVTYENKQFYIRRGIRFSVSHEDALFADVVLRSQSRKAIAGTARFAALCLDGYARESPDDVKGLYRKEGFNGIRALVESLRERDRPSWQYAGILKELALQRSHAREKTALFKQLLFDFKLADEEELHGGFAFLADTGPRFRSAEARIISGPARDRYLVFELLPPFVNTDKWRQAIRKRDWWELEGPSPLREVG